MSRGIEGWERGHGATEKSHWPFRQFLLWKCIIHLSLSNDMSPPPLRLCCWICSCLFYRFILLVLLFDMCCQRLTASVYFVCFFAGPSFTRMQCCVFEIGCFNKVILAFDSCDFQRYYEWQLNRSGVIQPIQSTQKILDRSQQIDRWDILRNKSLLQQCTSMGMQQQKPG